MKLWLDDVCDPKSVAGWEDAVWVTAPDEAIEWLETGRVTAISLGDRPFDGGTAITTWIESQVVDDDLFMPPNIMNCHGVAIDFVREFRAIRRAMEARQW